MYLAMGVATAASIFLASLVLGSRGVRDSLVFVLAFPVWMMAHAVVFLLERGGSWWTDMRRHTGRIGKGDRDVPMDPTGRMVRHLALLLDETRAVRPHGSQKVAEAVEWAFSAGAQFVSVFDPRGMHFFS
ncbi:hypothetical protein T484DRAFT_1913089 [Baffinella frigidus]|nr:hypothetical protein T484DRAFT_1913089 [Cryptophyta sp. CCMP2293]